MPLKRKIIKFGTETAVQNIAGVGKSLNIHSQGRCNVGSCGEIILNVAISPINECWGSEPKNVNFVTNFIQIQDETNCLLS